MCCNNMLFAIQVVVSGTERGKEEEEQKARE